VRLIELYENKETAILDLVCEAGLMANGKGKALIFAEEKTTCDWLSSYLRREARVSCSAIHGSKDQGTRQKALEDFKSGNLKILVATDVAARGLDIKGVGLVVNYDAPKNIEIPEMSGHVRATSTGSEERVVLGQRALPSRS